VFLPCRGRACQLVYELVDEHREDRVQDDLLVTDGAGRDKTTFKKASAQELSPGRERRIGVMRRRNRKPIWPTIRLVF